MDELKSPCIGCDFEHEDKNKERCTNCEKRIKYASDQGLISIEALEADKAAREETRKILEMEAAGKPAKQKTGPKPKKEEKKMAQKQEELETLQSSAIQLILEHIRDKKHVGMEVDYALRALAAVGRIKATDRARDATQFMVLREITKDKKEFRKYVEVSLPHLNPMKQIEA